jgi:Domain of unknown function (DUF4389)
MASTYPLNIEVTSPSEVPRWRPLLNWLLVIPPLVWLLILTIGLEVVSVISWFVILFTGALPENFGNFMVQVLRYQWRVYAYLYAWTEEYPGFSPPAGYADPRDYPAVLNSVPDTTRNRLTVLLRFLWVIPQYIVLYFVGIAASVVLFIAWFAVLFTGKWPEGMRQFCIGYFRWSLRVSAYFFLLTDVYPPFSLEP